MPLAAGALEVRLELREHDDGDPWLVPGRELGLVHLSKKISFIMGYISFRTLF